jgi:hypothetical protein
MFDALAEFVSTQPGDSGEFVEKARALVVGVARDYQPARLYVIRIDNWFGPKWMHFAGKFSAGKHFYLGVHKTRLHVPPFVPHRVIGQRVFVGPDYEETVVTPPLHVECPSKEALLRRIEDIDNNAAFVWFSGASEEQKRGAAMVYLPFAVDKTDHSRVGFRRAGAFYVGFSQREKDWEPAMLRGISRAELVHLEALGQGAELEKIG